jgi:CheY-like chemotaxis protein
LNIRQYSGSSITNIPDIITQEKFMPEHITTILHIEDNPENRILVRRLLQVEGYHILEAENAQQALQILSNHSPRLILVDINMPDMDGYTLTSKIRKLPEHHTVFL